MACRSQAQAQDGARLHVDVEGEGPTALLIHGAASAGVGWGSVFDELARSHRVIRLDRRGYGASGGEPTPDNQVHARDAAAVLRALDAAPATVVGWSRGGMVALELALAEPDLVERLVLVEPGFEPTKHMNRSLARMFLGFHARRQFDERGAIDRMMRWATARRDGGSSWEDEAFGDERRQAVFSNGRAIAREWALRQPDKLTRARVAQVSVPVTVLLGEQSQPWFERMAAAVAEALPNAQLVRVPGATHEFPYAAPAAIVDAIRPAVAAQRA